MGLLSCLISRESFREKTGLDDEAYWRSEGILWVRFCFFAIAVAVVVGVGYIGYRLWTEIALEIRYYQQFGATWRAEYESVYGSLSDIHLRMLIVSVCLLALFAIVFWIVRRFYKNHRRRSHKHTA